MSNIHYASIRSLDISNGEGVGTALFVQGCPFNPHCYNCFNPETWDFNGGKEWTQETEDKFIKLSSRPYIKRISILGGEPLADKNLDGVLKLVDKIRLLLPNKTIWIYSGYTFDEIFENSNIAVDDITLNAYENYKKRQKIIHMCNILVDGKYIDSKRDMSLKWRGSNNQRVIDIKKSLQQNKIVLYCS